MDRLWVADKHRFDSPSGLLSPGSWGGLAPLLRRLRRERYDQLLLLHHLTTAFGAAKYALLLRAIGAARTIGLDNGRGWFLDERVPDSGFGDRHEVDYALAVAAAAGARVPAEPRLELGPASPLPPRWEEARVIAPDAPWIALHAGGGTYSLARRWPPACFAEVGLRLAKRAREPSPGDMARQGRVDATAKARGARLVLLGAEVDREANRLVAAALGPGLALDLTGQTTLGETAAVLRECALLVSNDSGLAYLAAAAGTPVVAVFGPSNDRAWGPYPPSRHRVVRASLPCSPCFYRGKQLGTPQGCATRDCLRLVTPDMVVAAAEELLISGRDSPPFVRAPEEVPGRPAARPA